MTPIEFYHSELEKYKNGREYRSIKDHFKKMENVPFVCPRAVCADGFSFSMQASKYHYSIPCVTGHSYYDAMEIGYLSDEEPLLDKYKEHDLYFKDPVYMAVAYVDIEKMVGKHGGIVGPEDRPYRASYHTLPYTQDKKAR